MSPRTTSWLLADILERIERIERFVASGDMESFVIDERTSDAVVRNLEVIGEAAARLPEQLKARHPEIPWRRVVGLRNRIVHQYFDVDLDLVWEIVRMELPALREQIREISGEEHTDPE